MRRDEAALLRAQLEEATAADAHPLERAALAGLLQRLAPDDPLLSATRGGPDAGAALDEDVEDALDQLLAVDEDDDSAESWDALCALDELCAAATFLGHPDRIAAAVDEACRLVRAFPEPWAAHADAAAELLRDRAPRPGDPAAALWAAVEASQWPAGVAPRADEDGAPLGARRRLGLDVVVSLMAFRQRVPIRLAAAGALPEEPAWLGLGRGTGWEVALTEGDTGEPVLLLSSAEGRLSRDGEAVAATPGPDGLVCAATPGEWTISVGDETLDFRIER